jgi:hypothetical protein
LNIMIFIIIQSINFNNIIIWGINIIFFITIELIIFRTQIIIYLILILLEKLLYLETQDPIVLNLNKGPMKIKS